MTILNTPYDTSTERGRQLGVIRDALEFCIQTGALDAFSPTERIVYVRGKGTHIDAIPPFLHPLQIDPKDKDLLAVDLRTYVSLVNDYTGTNYRVRRPAHYQAQMARTLFTRKWLIDGPMSLLIVSATPMGAYANWIKDAFANKITLPEGQTIRILAAYYFYCQHTNETEFNPRQMNDIVSLMQRATRLSNSTIMETIGQLARTNGTFGAITSLEDFCKTVSEVTASPRLRSLTPAAILPILANTWDGSESKALVATAVEFPPTWYAYFLISLITRQPKSRLWSAVHNSISKTEVGFIAQAFIASIQFDAKSRQGVETPQKEQVVGYV